MIQFCFSFWLMCLSVSLVPLWIKNHLLSQKKNYLGHWRPVLHESIIQSKAFIWKMDSQLQQPSFEVTGVGTEGSFTSCEGKLVNQLLSAFILLTTRKHTVISIPTFPWEVLFNKSGLFFKNALKTNSSDHSFKISINYSRFSWGEMLYQCYSTRNYGQKKACQKFDTAR